MTGLKEETITVRLRGSAGQSLGAFAVQGLKLEVHGDANDYVGKGLSGGLISIRPMAASPLVPQDHTIMVILCFMGRLLVNYLPLAKLVRGWRFAIQGPSQWLRAVGLTDVNT
jgi:hypothetical protein